VLDAQLEQDRRDVRLHRFEADAEPFGDRVVREVFSQQREDLGFARCEDVRGFRPSATLHATSIMSATANYIPLDASRGALTAQGSMDNLSSDCRRPTGSPTSGS